MGHCSNNFLSVFSQLHLLVHLLNRETCLFPSFILFQLIFSRFAGVVEKEVITLLLVIASWAWSCLTIKLANLARNEYIWNATSKEILSGKFIEAGVSICVFSIFHYTHGFITSPVPYTLFFSLSGLDSFFGSVPKWDLVHFCPPQHLPVSASMCLSRRPPCTLTPVIALVSQWSFP